MRTEEERSARRSYARRKKGAFNANGETRRGPCEICGHVRNLRYDHDHVTGQFRGWLCNWCNLALGWWEKMARKRLLKKIEGYFYAHGGEIGPDTFFVTLFGEDVTHRSHPNLSKLCEK